MPRWIKFNLARKQNPKTFVWDVETLDGQHRLGQVAWFGRWRRYAFFPGPTGTVFEATCLRDLADFCEEQTRLRREARKAT